MLARSNFTLAGRLVLVKFVLCAQPVHILTTINVPKEVLEEIDKFRRQFLWAGNENLTEGKCKVNWSTMVRPLDLWGLGILDIHRFARALRFLWLWRVGVGILKPKTEPEPNPNRANYWSIRVFGFGFGSYMCYISGYGFGFGS
jgi:hypothetical protein